MFSFYDSFIWRIVYTIYFRDLDNFCHTYELYTWVLLDCLLFLKFLLYLRTKAVCFQNVVYYILFTMMIEIFQNHGSEYFNSDVLQCMIFHCIIFCVIEDSLLRSPASLSVLLCMLVPLCIL